MGVKVKICGITNLDDAWVAVEAGADLLGFVFYEGSLRQVTLPVAAEIARQLPPHALRVGVFVNAPAAAVRQAIAACGLNLLQFHGDEPPDYCQQFDVKTMKAFRIRDAESLRALPRFKTNFWLLNAFTPEKPGGTGETFDWGLAIEAQKLGGPIFLAGGLTPENVAGAVRKVRPYGVDVSGGVESSPGKKERAKIQAFIQAARAAGAGGK